MKHPGRGLFFLACLLLAATLLALGLGGAAFDFSGLTAPDNSPTAIIIWQIRLPRILLAISGGASLALAGAALQAILMNPLADPYLLGVSSGASLGAALAIVLGFSLVNGPYWLVINALLTAVLAAFLIYGLARLRKTSANTIILAGLAMNFIFSALVASLQFLARESQLRDLMYWMMGSLWNASLTASAFIAAALGVGFLILLSQAWNLNALAAGEEIALSLGIKVQRLNLLALAVACLLTAVVVAFMGAVGFVGLLAPHLARAFFGHDHRFLLPAACLCGALLLLTADSAARLLLWPLDIPVGIMTALLGGPFFIYLLIRTRNYWWQ
jgi:iron complex transport system permease protein